MTNWKLTLKIFVIFKYQAFFTEKYRQFVQFDLSIYNVYNT